MIFLGDTNGSDKKLEDLSSATDMQKNGWVWSSNVRVNDLNYLGPDKYSDCSRYDKTWYGYANGAAIGTISATFHGSGSAVLNYGNCYFQGQVVVSLNGKEISRVGGFVFDKEISFNFAKGDILELKEINIAIIKLNTFKINVY